MAKCNLTRSTRSVTRLISKTLLVVCVSCGLCFGVEYSGVGTVDLADVIFSPVPGSGGSTATFDDVPAVFDFTVDLDLSQSVTIIDASISLAPQTLNVFGSSQVFLDVTGGDGFVVPQATYDLNPSSTDRFQTPLVSLQPTDDFHITGTWNNFGFQAEIDGAVPPIVCFCSSDRWQLEFDYTNYPNSVDVNLDSFTQFSQGTIALEPNYILSGVTLFSFSVGITLTPAPTNRSGDFNDDGFWNVEDLDLLTQVGDLVTGIADTTGNEQFDVNNDDVIDVADVEAWLSDAATVNGLASPYLFGDADLDGTVDGPDFLTWNTNKFTASFNWSQGNFVPDGQIDGADFLQWNTNKFQISDGVPAVPEPSAGMLVLLGLLTVLTRRRT